MVTGAYNTWWPDGSADRFGPGWRRVKGAGGEGDSAPYQEAGQNETIDEPTVTGIYWLPDAMPARRPSQGARPTPEERSDVPQMSQSPPRAIIEDFAKEIREKKLATAKPARTIINFRTDRADKNERPIVRVPLELLRFRKDNGRIASDVLDYESTCGVLDETDSAVQEKLAAFLKAKDPDTTVKLKRSIVHDGQLEPAIVTCDGFLINGNRRKMVLELLRKEQPHEPNYMYMNVVVLPGKDDEGGPPTLLDIERLENRYQLQSEGKAEYYGFDRALSIKRKVDIGLSLEDQLRDDPMYAGASPAQLQQAVKKWEKDYLRPLECVDRYLRYLERPGHYTSISSRAGDREGRWQAFIDYSAVYETHFRNRAKRLALGLDEADIGLIEQAAFSIIRLRSIPGMPKVHMIMRSLPKYCSTPEGREALLALAREPMLHQRKRQDEGQGEGGGTPDDAERKWEATAKGPITYHVKKAAASHEDRRERDTPVGLLDAAYKKLVHSEMSISIIPTEDLPKARKLASQIKKEAVEIEKAVYERLKAGN